MSKRYYWLKLKEDFFDDDTIRYIEEQENGFVYSSFYLKLCLKALKTDGVLVRMVGNQMIPYDIPSLARLTGISADFAAPAMQLLQQIGLVEQLADGKMLLPRINEMVGAETDRAEALRRKRAGDNLKDKEAACEQQTDAVSGESEHQANNVPDKSEHQANNVPRESEHQANNIPDKSEHQANIVPDKSEHCSLENRDKEIRDKEIRDKEIREREQETKTGAGAETGERAAPDEEQTFDAFAPCCPGGQPSPHNFPYHQVQKLYNETCTRLPRCQSVSESRKRAIRARFRSGSRLEDFRRLFEKAQASRFLSGDNPRGWQANFDWLIKDTNMVKVLEGTYDDPSEGGNNHGYQTCSQTARPENTAGGFEKIPGGLRL